jgi:type 1 glutamine amidotransferase
MSSHLLVFSRTTGWRHGAAIDAGLRFLHEHAASRWTRIFATEDPEYFESDMLRDASAVVWLNASGSDVLTDFQRERFEEYLRTGGGFAGVHCTSDAEVNWPVFDEIVGARVVGHPSKLAQRARLRIHQPEHASTSHLPDPWEWVEEWYTFRSPPTYAELLLSVDEDDYDHHPLEPTGAPHPVSWHGRFGDGRTWYTALGHHPGAYQDPLLQEHIWGGIESVRRDRPQS